jgi:hypothetical protein
MWRRQSGNFSHFFQFVAFKSLTGSISIKIILLVLAVDQLTQSTNKSKRHCVAIKFYLNE